jgi:hypothetical protein
VTNEIAAFVDVRRIRVQRRLGIGDRLQHLVPNIDESDRTPRGLRSVSRDDGHRLP